MKYTNLKGLEIAGGSVCGRDHRLAGAASQDAWWHARGENAVVAVVADGCGSGRASEVGARLGCRLFGESLRRRLDAGSSLADPQLWRHVRKDVLAHLRMLANAMGGSVADVVSEHFLFTVVGVAFTADLTAVFSIGDGLIAVNGDVRELGPYPDNQPPYLAYELLSASDVDVELHVLRATSEIEHVLIATDGAVDLCTAVGKRLPGSADTVAPISALWSDRRVFENRDALRRRLARLNREVTRPDWERQRLRREPGLLRDDTTVVVVRNP